MSKAASATGSVTLSPAAPAPARGKKKAKRRGAKGPEQDPVEVAARLGIYWLNAHGGGYFIRPPHQWEDGKKRPAEGSAEPIEWIRVNETQLTRWLMIAGVSRGNALNPIGTVEEVLSHVQAHRNVDAVFNLAGHAAGVEVLRDGMKVLIPKGPLLVRPVKGDWPVLQALLENLLMYPVESLPDDPLRRPPPPRVWKIHCKGGGPARDRAVWDQLLTPFMFHDGVERWALDQTAVLYTWLQQSLEVYHMRMAGRSDVMRNAPGLVVAGAPDSGKSFIQQYVIAPMFGSRVARPDSVLTGKTDFNADLIGNEMLVMGDSPLSTSYDDRKRLGEWLKNLIAEQWHRFHPKGKDVQGTVNPVWRFCWSINDDKNNLEQLPPMVDGVTDKLVVLHVQQAPMPMPTGTIDEFTAFTAKIREELPAFVHFLMYEWQPPAGLLGGRFGMVAVQAPDLMQELFEDSFHGAYLDLLDAARWQVNGERVDLWGYVGTRNIEAGMGRLVTDDGPPHWLGHWQELKALMTGAACSLYEEFQTKRFSRPELLLARLAKEEPDRVTKERRRQDGSNPRRLWCIYPP